MKNVRCSLLQYLSGIGYCKFVDILRILWLPIGNAQPGFLRVERQQIQLHSELVYQDQLFSYRF